VVRQAGQAAAADLAVQQAAGKPPGAGRGVPGPQPGPPVPPPQLLASGPQPLPLLGRALPPGPPGLDAHEGGPVGLTVVLEPVGQEQSWGVVLRALPAPREQAEQLRVSSHSFTPVESGGLIAPPSLGRAPCAPPG